VPRPIAFDITHLVSRLPVANPSGIDKVDLAYAQHFARRGCDAAVHYGLWRPRFHPGQAVGEVVNLASRSRWVGVEEDKDPALDRVVCFLTGRTDSVARLRAKGEHVQVAPLASDGWPRRLAQVRWRLSPSGHTLPNGALYLNVAQHVFEAPRFFQWLSARPDVLPVFLVHDLLPMDYPEYFRPGYRERFGRRLDTIVRHAKALITTSTAVKERLAQEYEARGRPAVPIHVAPLPSTMAPVDESALADPELAANPYFVVLGTIEPRKNHLLLLNVWRRLAETHPSPPKLVIVGVRGWENEQVLDVLDRSALVRPHVIEVSGVSDRGLLRLLANARALLMPSFAEGYGLPVVEALSVGTPVVASDIPVFQEVSQGCAVFHHPLDGPGWRQAVVTLSDLEHPATREARQKAQGFRAPSWDGYFDCVSAFLAEQ
jgi:glycosyltransferase involved in cell wall biosynthesis